MKDRAAREDIASLTSWVGKILRRWSERLDEVDELERRQDALLSRVEALEGGPLPLAPGVSGLRSRLTGDIEAERPVIFRYTKEGETDWSCRRLSPYEIIDGQRGVVVRGWDHDRHEIRSFRLDRMDALTSYPVAYRVPRPV